VGEALFELDDALSGAEQRIATRPDDLALQRLNAVVEQVNALARIRTRTDRLSVGQINALIALLSRIGR
jgi:hypothetical protein